MSKRIITINRMFGSNGRIIGKALAEELGFKFYDKELIEIASKEKKIPFDEFARVDERKASQWLYPVDYELQMNPEYHFVPMNSGGSRQGRLCDRRTLRQLHSSGCQR